MILKKIQYFINNFQIINTKDSRKKTKIIYLINKILDNSEKNGVGLLKSHVSLGKGELFTFHIEIESSGYSQNMEKIFTLQINGNASVFELRYEIAKKLSLDADSVIDIILFTLILI